MVDDQHSEDYGIIPSDASRDLIIPAEMADRGLELAIKIQRERGIEKYNKPILKFPGLLKSSCVNFSKNGEFAAITSHGMQKDNPGLVIWNMGNRVLSVFPEAGFQIAAPSHPFVERIPSDEQMGIPKESSPISEIKISATEKRYKPTGDPESKPWDINSVALSKCGDLALIGYRDGSIGRCEIVDGVISNFKIIGKDPYEEEIGAITISPDSRIFANSMHIVRIWDIEMSREIRRLEEGYNPFYNQLSFSDDGSKLLVAHGMSKNRWTSCLTLLDINGNEPPVICLPNRPMNVSAVSVSPDNRILLSLDDGIITVWDAKRGEEIRHWKHTRADVHDVIRDEPTQWPNLRFQVKNPIIWGFSSVAISPDGKRILSGGGDNFMRLWTLAGHELWEYPHDSRVVKVAFHPNGRRALSGCWDGSVYIWNLP